MSRETERGESPLWQDTATIAALLACYDVWSATPQRDCAADLLRAIGSGAGR